MYKGHCGLKNLRTTHEFWEPRCHCFMYVFCKYTHIYLLYYLLLCTYYSKTQYWWCKIIYCAGNLVIVAIVNVHIIYGKLVNCRCKSFHGRKKLKNKIMVSRSNLYCWLCHYLLHVSFSSRTSPKTYAGRRTLPLRHYYTFWLVLFDRKSPINKHSCSHNLARQ